MTDDGTARPPEAAPRVGDHAPGASDDPTEPPLGSRDPVLDAAPDPTEPPLDPAEGLRIIAAQTARVRSREPDSRLIFAAWGAAWLLGYLALYLTATGRLGQPRVTDGVEQPATWAFAVFGLSIIGAMAFTVLHSVRANAGIQGVSASFGAMYGWTWCLGFVGMSVMLGGLARAGAGPEVMALASNACACLLVGVLYMAGGAFWQDRQQYAIGVWIVLVAALSVFAGLPQTYLVMAVLGGGGFFVGMVLEHLRRRRHPSAGAGFAVAGRPVGA